MSDLGQPPDRPNLSPEPVLPDPDLPPPIPNTPFVRPGPGTGGAPRRRPPAAPEFVPIRPSAAPKPPTPEPIVMAADQPPPAEPPAERQTPPTSEQPTDEPDIPPATAPLGSLAASESIALEMSQEPDDASVEHGDRAGSPASEPPPPPETGTNEPATTQGEPEAADGQQPEPELYTRITETAEELYGDFAARFETDPSIVHRGEFCGYVPPQLKTELENQGIEVNERSGRLADGTPHSHLETTDGVIIDPTWQQFVDPSKLSPDLPKVLTGTPDEIRDFLHSHEMEDISGIWLDDPAATPQPLREDEDWGWRGAEPREADYTGSEEWPSYGVIHAEAAPDPVQADDAAEPTQQPATPAPVVPPRVPVEIRHTNTRDIIANREHTDTGLVNRAVAEVSDGIPETWHRIPTDDPDKEYYTDSPTNPTLFAKSRGVSPAGYRESIARTQADTSLTETEKTDIIGAIKAHNSVLHEIQIAPDVERAFAAEEVQQMVRDHGYDSISLVKPLAAIVDKTTGEKTVVYPWQEGYQVFGTDPDDPDEVIPTSPEYDQVDEVTGRLFDHLWDYGIRANDLSLIQVIVRADPSGRKHLFVTDIDRFSRL
jgi:hypothetical protein